MLFITFGSSIFAKELPGCVSIGDQALFTQRGSSIILCFALRLLVVFIENIRDSIETQNGVNSIRLFLRDVENQKAIDIPRFFSVLHSNLLNKV
jgi:hypothetical protein